MPDPDELSFAGVAREVLRADEKAVLDASGDFFAAFCKLPQEHPNDLEDVMFHLHAIQNIILARPTLRALRLEETLAAAAKANAELEAKGNHE